MQPGAEPPAPLPARALAFALAAIALASLPTLVTHQVPLLLSDTGWDLYAMQEVARGYTPVRDFQWPYGPLGLYYFAGWFLALGESVRTARLAYFGLLLFATLFSVISSWRRAGPLAALVGAFLLFHWGQPPALLTQGGLIPLSVLALEAALRAAERRRAGDEAGTRRAVLGLVAAQAALFLVKPTIAIATSGGFGVGLALSHLLAARAAGTPGGVGAALRPRALALPAAAALGPVLAGALLFAPWIAGVAEYRLRQTFPWSPSLYPNRLAWTDSLFALFDALRFAGQGRMSWAFLADRYYLLPWAWVAVVCGGAAAVAQTWRRRERPGLAPILLPLAAAGGCEFVLLGNVHSLATAGVVAVAAGFGRAVGAAAGRGAARGGPGWGLAAAVAGAALAATVAQHARLIHEAEPLDLARAQVQVAPPQLARVERAVVAFLEHNLGPDEELLVLPYAPLFNFLSGRRSPIYSVQQVLPHRAPEEDEEYARAVLEQSPPCVLVVNFSTPGPQFGRDYGLKLQWTLDLAYRQVGLIGDGPWQMQAGNEVVNPQVKVFWRRDLPAPAWWPR